MSILQHLALFSFLNWLFVLLIILLIFGFSIKEILFRSKNDQDQFLKFENNIISFLRENEFELNMLKRTTIDHIPNQVFSVFQLTLPAMFGSSESSYYWQAKITKEKKEIIVFLEITESLYKKKASIIVKDKKGNTIINKKEYPS